MSPTPEEALQHVDIFRGLSEGQISRLAEAGKEVTSPTGKAIAAEGGLALAFHVIIEGEAEVSHHGSVLRTLGPGDYFGEISMIDGKPRSATVTATSDLTAFAISHTAFKDLVDTHAKIASNLLVALCARIRDAEAR